MVDTAGKRTGVEKLLFTNHPLWVTPDNPRGQHRHLLAVRVRFPRRIMRWLRPSICKIIQFQSQDLDANTYYSRKTDKLLYSPGAES
jgi:hypothetical protein